MLDQGRSVRDVAREAGRRPRDSAQLSRQVAPLCLEAARSPGLATVLGHTLRRGYRDDVAFHATTGLAGGPFEIALLHYALDGLLLDLLTTSIGADAEPDDVVAAFVDRLVL